MAAKKVKRSRPAKIKAKAKAKPKPKPSPKRRAHASGKQCAEARIGAEIMRRYGLMRYRLHMIKEHMALLLQHSVCAGENRVPVEGCRCDVCATTRQLVDCISRVDLG